ncbi:ABC transporter permease subunit [Sinorhizobium meliloti]|nr:ABC transporter permease subunit [Sinorhizobium meliloti]
MRSWRISAASFRPHGTRDVGTLTAHSSACRWAFSPPSSAAASPTRLFRVIGLVGYSVPIFWLALPLCSSSMRGCNGSPIPPHRYRLRISFTAGHRFLPPGLGLAGQWDVSRRLPAHHPAGFAARLFLARPISRMTRSFMLNELQQEYIVAARAKGLSEARIIWTHALRNAAVPLVTVIALSYAGLLEGSVLTETVFAWPGLGLYITNSLQNADMNAVLGGTIIIGSVFIAINLLSDLLYRTLDPRTRAR